jgi:cytochrome o ubiquinol oxidase operon protein cyoD
MSKQVGTEAGHGSVRTYTTGFVLSVSLTIVAFIAAGTHAIHGWTLVGVLLLLAVIQLFIQLVFFLHLNRESKPRWNRTALAFAAMVVLVIVFGSLWIMKNLAYDHHPALSPQQTDTSIIKDEGF